jgi:hypothetical protein
MHFGVFNGFEDIDDLFFGGHRYRKNSMIRLVGLSSLLTKAEEIHFAAEN